MDPALKPPAPDPTPPRLRFPRKQRLSGKAVFNAVFQTGTRAAMGPILVISAPNGLTYHRLGLSVGRRVGNAVTRHRIKRCLREAFRLGIAAPIQTNVNASIPVAPNPDDPTPTDSQTPPPAPPAAPAAPGLDIVVAVRPHDHASFRTQDYRSLLERGLRKALKRRQK